METKQRCSKQINHGTWGRKHQCSRSAKKDGFCTIHHPAAVKAKTEKKMEEFSNRRNREMIKYHKLAMYGELVEKLAAAYSRLDQFRSEGAMNSAADCALTSGIIATLTKARGEK